MSQGWPRNLLQPSVHPEHLEHAVCMEACLATTDLQLLTSRWSTSKTPFAWRLAWPLPASSSSLRACRAAFMDYGAECLSFRRYVICYYFVQVAFLEKGSEQLCSHCLHAVSGALNVPLSNRAWDQEYRLLPLSTKPHRIKRSLRPPFVFSNPKGPVLQNGLGFAGVGSSERSGSIQKAEPPILDYNTRMVYRL